MNIRKIRQLILVFCIAVIPLFVGKKAYAAEWQYWNEFVFEHDLADRVALKIGLEQQVVDDISDFSLYNLTLGFSYSLAKWLAAGMEYKYEREEDGSGKWGTENRISGLVSFKKAASPWKCRLTAKLDYRDFEQEDKWRFRTKLKLQRTVCAEGFNLTPFVAEEPYYDFEADTWNQNRAFVGCAVGLAKRFELAVYYMNKLKKSDNSWTADHIIGTEVVVPF